MTLGLVAAAAPSWGQPGRVSGISVMITDATVVGPGREVDFDVTLTTSGTACGCLPTTTFPLPYFSFPPPTHGHLGDYALSTGFSGTLTSGPYTTTSLTSTTPGSGSPAGTSNFYRTYSYTTILRGQFAFQVNFDGAAPAIDYGDGATVPAATLPTVVDSSTTVGGNVRRVFRGSFTHMYADLSPHTIRVASACCPSGNTVTGTPITAAAYPMVIDLAAYLEYTVSYQGREFYRTVYHQPSSTRSTVNSGGPSSSYGPSPAFSTSTSYYTSTTLTTTGSPVQLVNSALVAAPAVIEIPTVGTWGLLGLAGLLALAALRLLVRG
jgi:hypothetical protein